MALVQDPNTGQLYDDTRGIMIPDFLSRLENIPMPPMPTLNMQPPENLLNVSNEPQPFIDPKMTMRPEDARTIPQMQYIAAQNPEIPNRFPMKDAPVRTVPQTQTIKGPGNNLQATAQVPSVSKARADELRQQYGVDPRPDPLADYKAVMNREPGFFQENAPLILGLLGGVSGLLEAMGPSRTPVSSGQVFARGLQSGLGGYMGGLKYQQGAKKAQQEEARNLLDEVTFRQSFENAELKKQQSANLKTAIREGLRDLQGVNLSSEMQRQVRLAESLLNAGAIGSAYQVFSKIAPTPAAQPSIEKMGDKSLLYVEPQETGMPKVTELYNVPEKIDQIGAPLPQISFMTGEQVIQTFPNLEGDVDPTSNYRPQYNDQGQIINFEKFDLTEEPQTTAELMADIAKGEGTVAKRYRDEAKDYFSIADSFKKVKAAAEEGTPAGDISLIFAYMKMLDPGSVVREGEFATAQNTGSVSERVYVLYNKALKGDRLTPSQRQMFMKSANTVLESQKDRSQNLMDFYTKISNDYGYKVERIVRDPFEGIEQIIIEGSESQPDPFKRNPAPSQNLNFGRAKQQDG